MVGLSMLTLPEVQELLFRQPHRERPLSIRARRYGIALRRKLEVPGMLALLAIQCGGAMPGMDSGRSSAPLARRGHQRALFCWGREARQVVIRLAVFVGCVVWVVMVLPCCATGRVCGPCWRRASSASGLPRQRDHLGCRAVTSAGGVAFVVGAPQLSGLSLTSLDTRV